MKWFSQRKGLKKVRTEIQVDSIDEALTNRLWNVFLVHYLTPMQDYPSAHLRGMQIFVIRFYDKYLKSPIDRAPRNQSSIYGRIEEFFFTCGWNELYDFLELIVAYHPDENTKESFMKDCNAVLESELSAYRFVGEKITQITSKEEISEIEEALQTPLKPVRAHLGKSLELLSDKKSPDYRNSIKESISAVEAICRLISDDENATLGQALKVVEDKVGLHGALKRGFSSLYGYTSSADGIRHALLEEAKLNFEDAKFMLVSCSAFINYLISKASKAGIKIR